MFIRKKEGKEGRVEEERRKREKKGKEKCLVLVIGVVNCQAIICFLNLDATDYSLFPRKWNNAFSLHHTQSDSSTYL